jgi:hypothetical protein
LVYPPIIVKKKMKTWLTASLLIVSIGMIGAADIDSSQFINHLMNLSEPEGPVVLEDVVLFTASSNYRRVGIAFAHEGYSRIYWYRKLMVPQDPAVIAAAGKKKIDPHRDSGILFHAASVPPGLKVLEYRMVIDGLWTADPLNPRHSLLAGLSQSVVPLPERPAPALTAGEEGVLRFTYDAPPGELITVGGSFNRWDPFMYALREVRPGFYSLSLPLPPGIYQYVFFHRGDRLLDPRNPRKIYTKDSKAASEAEVR